MSGELTWRRDQGMAGLASFLSSQFPGSPACLWAHTGHISKENNTPRMGRFIATRDGGSAVRYYAVGFYLYQEPPEHGTTRARSV